MKTVNFSFEVVVGAGVGAMGGLLPSVDEEPLVGGRIVSVI